MDKIEIRFGHRVKEIRVKQNISQEELAFRCGLSKNYISDVERGTRNISLRSIEKIADGFAISIKELFEFK
ncbi:helix-turn-helix domain-containing protein [Thomasclavelia saccharogumia]|uniref:helix-turn-helix domain-containing protein n=1 Tax=Thomasclavelia saccharogumia TaxID=341225 RepID=UPI000479236C|nr:helix-turn-helix transcriptional regulator [Thomasclavelia saccharogumia]